MNATSREPEPEPRGDALQDALLRGVSRTFALTIPELPRPLSRVVGNGYLLCRVADTIEDAPGVAPVERRRLHALFSAAVEGAVAPARLVRELEPLARARIPAPERELLARCDRVVALTHTFDPRQQAALARCVRTMGEGMDRFQTGDGRSGLASLGELHAYCYYVAGVVGEMLTELFCLHSPAIEARRAQLEARTVSFGQGLQMTNILKDVWEDRARGFTWLPRDVFGRFGLELGALEEASADPTAPAARAFRRGLEELLAIAHGHLRDALDYTLLVPRAETGIRRFCLRALGMAILTLRKIHGNPAFRSGREVKITRSTVRATVRASDWCAARDTLVRVLFRLCALGLPHADAGRAAAQPGGARG